MNKSIEVLNINTIQSRGNMNVLENNKNPLPFEIKRIFYMYDVDINDSRGNHANLFSQFVFIALQGSVDIDITYLNGVKECIHLNRPDRALYIPNMIWKKMYSFSKDCILLILSDKLYDKNEYIYDINSFFERECC